MAYHNDFQAALLEQQLHQQQQQWVWPTHSDFTARLNAVQLAIQCADNSMMPYQFSDVLTNAETLYRFLTGQSTEAK